MATVAELSVLISAEIGDLVRGFSDAQSRMKKFGDELQGVGARMTIGITAPLALMGAAIIKVGTDYEKAMNLFQVNARASADEMVRAGQVAKQLGADMQLPATSAGDAALAMNELAKGGLTASEAMDAVKGTLQLAAAASISEAEAALMTATALNVFGLAAGESARVTDLLAAAANASLAEITDIGLAMSQAANVFASSKVSVEDLTTSIALMAQAGIKGSDAGTSLKTMMLALQAPTDKAASTMKQLGINIFDAHGNFIPFRSMIEQVSGALKGMTEQQQAAALKTIFGTDAIRAANVVLAKGTEAFDEMSKAVTRSGVAQEVAAARAKGLSGAIDGLVSQLETLGLVIFQAVGPALESTVRMLADLVGNLGQADKAVIQAGVTMAAVFAAAGPIVLGIGLVISLIGGPLTLAVVGLTAAVAVLAGEWVLDMNNMNKSSSITAEDVKKKFIDLAVTIGHVLDAISFAANLVAATVKALGGLMLAAFTPILTIIYVIEDGVKAGLKRMGDNWENLNKSYVASTNAMGAAVEGRWSTMLGNLVRGMANAQQQIVRGWGETERAFQARSKINWGGASGPAAPVNFEKDLKASMARAAGIAKTGGAAVAKAFSDGFSEVQEWLRSTGSNLDITKKAWDSLGKTVQDNFKALQRAYEVDQVAVQRWGLVLLSIFGKIGQEVVKLANGHLVIRSSTIALVSHVEDVAVSIDKMIIPISHVDALAKKMGATLLNTGEESAKAFRALSEQFEDLSNSLPQSWNTIIDGMLQGTGRAGSALKELGVKVKGFANDILNVFDTMPGKWGQALSKGVSEVNKWVNFIDSALKLLNRFFSSVPAGLGDLITKVVGVFKGVSAAVSSTVSTAGTAASAAVSGMAATTTASTAAATAGWIGLGAGAQSASTMIVGAAHKAGDAVDAMNKKTQSSVSKLSSGLIGNLGAIAGAIGGVAMVLGVQGMGKVQGTLQGALGGLTAGASIGFMVGGPVGAGIGALIGGIGGAIAGFFGSGKTAAQKAAEAQSLEQAKMSMQQTAQNIVNSALEGFNKGLEFLEKLDEFTAPRKAKFQAFFKSFTKLLDYFVELSKSWSTTSFAQVKAAGEAIGPIADAISRLPLAFDAINGHFGVAQSAIDRFFADFDRVMTAFFERSEVWIDGISKRAMKVANRLNPVVALISGFAGSMTSISEIKEPTDEMFAIFDRVLEKIVSHVEALSGKFDKSVLKVMANFADRAGAALSLWTSAIDAIKATVDIPKVTDADAEAIVSGIELFIAKLGASLERLASTDLTRISAFATTILPISAALKSWAETSAAVRGYTLISAEAWEGIVTDFGKAISLMGVLIGQATQFEEMAISLETKLKSGAQHLADGVAAMAAAVVGTASALQSAFGHIQGGEVGAMSVGTSSFGSMSATSTGSSASSAPVNVTIGQIIVDPTKWKNVSEMLEWFGSQGIELTNLNANGMGFDAALSQYGG